VSTYFKTDRATPIALDVWKDPQGFVLIEHVRDEAWLTFRCWDSAGSIAAHVGCLHFEGVWHLSSNRFQKTRSYPDIEVTDLVSYYLEVKNSSLLKALHDQRTAHDPDWKSFDKRKYRHWVVESHDFYTEITASRVSFSELEGVEAKRCFTVWDAI
jgi:hypothetical protein